MSQELENTFPQKLEAGKKTKLCEYGVIQNFTYGSYGSNFCAE
jgi:hypothetical protein